MASTIYVCEGNCKGEHPTPIKVGEQEAPPKCADPECTKYQKPLTKYKVCPKCLKKYKEGEKHSCS